MNSPATLAVSSGDVATDSNVRPARRPNAALPVPLRPNPEFAHSPVADELVARLKLYQRNPAAVGRTENGARSEELVRNAYAVAREAHGKQTRDSGEPYIDHPVAVAHILLDLQLDAASVAAALLHDVIEDTIVTKEQVATLFGDEIANLVDGVTKLSALEARTREEAQVGTYRKMFIAMADDPRVVLVKLADRLHNIRTIGSISDERQKRMARETLEIYAPLAHRLGIWQIKWELEDRAFAILNPEKYQEISRQLALRRDARERLVHRVIQRLRQVLEKEGIKAEITGRPKHIYSIYRKMERKGVSLDQIYDQLAVRVIVNSVADCYRVLGIVHAAWPPVPGEFDDYIAMPKESMYRSLHTTVLIPGGQPCEVQIRTVDMHEVAERGIAAHWRYKEGFSRTDTSFESKLAWLRGLIEWRRDLTDAHEFVDSFKSDVLEEQVYVFTPKGKIIDLPVGATPVDFAYRIHSDIGHSCVGAKVNNRIVPLDYQLQNGEIVHIMTSKTPRGPSRDWLNFVKTSGARNHIRRYFKRLDRTENIAAGRDLLEKELKRLGLSVPFEEIVAITGLKTIDEVFAQIGSGDTTARQVAQKILTHRAPTGADDLADIPQVTPPPERTTDPSIISVRGVDRVLTRLARCCNPVVGEPIVGFVTRGKGITVHRADCRTIINERDRARLVEVTWGAAAPRQGYPVPVRIEAWDRVGLWRDVSGTIADAGINIDAVEQVMTRRPGRAVLAAILRIQSIAQLTSILDKLNRLPDVIEARREQNTAPGA
ncbi:MAG: bifunctional (p)ppGpp synthetase/guanosine-3',5'-bis(diphosphate) 3'-pyrophosphohydrolase [Chloroflexi bacterium]|nr:bifunctional (p)ppGpp synthetase/guanosine-3',5'-bis(diphosphate) 3'-pyrophosphohydrolase [Chloroflexota bacterium]